uniref:Uncharacterized protein n=1 Tax=Romanomermis culicivorax TaxID=13658 RepID=A0A915IN81_ROMCU
MELQSVGYNVVEMWECELLQQIHLNPKMKTFFATIETPEPINHPEVLSCQHGGKLLFPSCNTYTHALQKSTWEHNEEDCALNGTRVTVELYKALEKGYKIFEVWLYDYVEQYHRTRYHDGGLFTQYVNIFMKMKLENTVKDV